MLVVIAAVAVLCMDGVVVRRPTRFIGMLVRQRRMSGKRDINFMRNALIAY